MRGTQTGTRRLFWVFSALLLVAPLWGCLDDDGSPVDVEGELALEYLGTDACAACHAEIVGSFYKTGHPYKLNKVEEGKAPFYPFSTVPSPPDGYSWSDITYVIGGYGWKARFIGQDGYIITDGGQNQYNLATEGWVDYHKDERKAYDCGPCHMTAYSPVGNQDGLEGLIGTWEAPGVHCEECHGPGSLHALNPGQIGMTVDTRADACGKCHNRGGYNTTIPASGGFTKHHEQGNEHLNSPHKDLNCVTCHDPHVTAVYQGAPGMRAECESCHAGAAESWAASPINEAMGDVECIDCHMPKSAKSALAFGEYEGDIRSHLIKINPSADAEPFSADGTTTNPYVTTEFACLNCHGDESKEWAEAGSALVHGAGKPLSSAYVGSAQCQVCHEDYYEKVFDSAHPYKLNKVVNGQPPTYPFSTVPAPPAGVTWDDVSYVIGGYGWKARFVGLDGYIITEGGQNQWNLATEGWVDYHKDEIKPYDCGTCHTTGYSPEGHQDGLPGLIGTWSEPGVGCEACHGPGAAHIQIPEVVPMSIDTRSDACGSCHNRGGYNTTIPASGGFTKHHEQGNEHLNSPHVNLNCVTCHDPHTAVVYADEAGVEPVRAVCESCHAEATESFNASALAQEHTAVECIDCHMPKSAKSALAFGPYEGDIRSPTNPYVTTGFACLNCHGDEDKAWAEAGAAVVHKPDPPLSSAYVGSGQCQACHQDNYSDVFESGHPYKLNKVVNGQSPSYPFTADLSPPVGYGWDDISYVIGGYGWKARFIGLDGFIITAGGKNQWNILTQTWTDYHKDEVKPYDCGTCHTTGYSPEGHQDGLPGLIGTWSEPGVGCEACHGPGAAHIQNPGVVAMTVDTRPEACGSCHNRGGVNSTIPASGGFIKHHEQYNEMANSSHIQLSCLSCHDPHKATRWRAGVGPGGASAQFAGTGPQRIGGVSVDCESCHTDARASLQANAAADDHGDSTCEACHMPPMTKSAVALGTYKGDVATHMWKINASATAEPFSPDGTVASGFLTTEFSCLRSGCHSDKDKVWAEDEHEEIHGAGFSAVGALTIGRNR